MIKIITSIILSILLSGCATKKLGDLPSLKEEFNLSLDVLKKKYPDITAYNEGIGHCTSVEEFISKLGDPSRVDTEYFQVPALSVPIGISVGGPGGVAAIVIAYSMFPEQPKKYYWVKGKYLISARVLTDIMCGYDNRIHMFEWKETK